MSGSTPAPWRRASAASARARYRLIGLFFFVSSTLRTEQAIRRVIEILVVGVSGIAACAMIEQRLHFNPFDHLAAVLPFLQFAGPVETTRDVQVLPDGMAELRVALVRRPSRPPTTTATATHATSPRASSRAGDPVVDATRAVERSVGASRRWLSRLGF